MKQPKPQSNAECQGCLKRKPLLMPVAIIPGWPVVAWLNLCLECRMNARYEKSQNHPAQHSTWGDAFKFSRLKKQRDAYDEWLLVESL